MNANFVSCYQGPIEAITLNSQSSLIWSKSQSSQDFISENNIGHYLKISSLLEVMISWCFKFLFINFENLDWDVFVRWEACAVPASRPQMAFDTHNDISSLLIVDPIVSARRFCVCDKVTIIFSHFTKKNIWLFTLSSSVVSIYALHQGRCGKNIPSCWCFTNIPKKFFQILHFPCGNSVSSISHLPMSELWPRRLHKANKHQVTSSNNV